MKEGTGGLNSRLSAKKGSSNPSSCSKTLKISISQDFEIPKNKKVKQLELYAFSLEYPDCFTFMVETTGLEPVASCV